MFLPAPQDWFVGEVPSAAKFNWNIRDLGNFLMGPPRAAVYRSSGQSIPDQVWTPIAFNAEYYDSDGMHASTGFTNRITINTTGLYLIRSTTTFAGNTAGRRGQAVRKNANGDIAQGTNVADQWYPVTVNAVQARAEFTTEHELAAGEYIEQFVWHSVGSALNTGSGMGYQSLAVRFVGKALTL
jgi:hypothetical protein